MFKILKSIWGHICGQIHDISSWVVIIRANIGPEVSSKWVGLYSFRLRSSFLKVTLHFLIFFLHFPRFVSA